MLGPVGAADDWLQAGQNAGRTSETGEPGIPSPDVALRVAIPGARVSLAPPLVFGRAVHVLVDLPEGKGAVVAVGLDTALVRKIVEIDARPFAFSSDGTRIFVLRDGGLDAHPVGGGAGLWTWPFPRLVDRHERYHCASPAVADGTIYVACTDSGHRGPAGPRTFEVEEQEIPFAAALDAATGRVKWAWIRSLPDESAGPAGSAGRASTKSHFLAISVLGSRLLIVSYDEKRFSVSDGNALDQIQIPGYISHSLWALRASDGERLWSLNASLAGGVVHGPQLYEPVPGAAIPTGTPEEIYVKLGWDLLALDGVAGTVLWRHHLREGGSWVEDHAAGLAFKPGALFVRGPISLSRLDPGTGRVEWSLPMDQEEPWQLLPGPALAQPLVYARELPSLADGATRVRAFRSDTGEEAWRILVPFDGGWNGGAPHLFAAGDGVLALAGQDASVTVLGRTAASITVHASLDTTRPRPGSPARVDLSATTPGVHGPAISFRAEWGDGNSTEWSPSPVLAHVYANPGEREARFWARNDGGQTASAAVLLSVGAPPAAITDLVPARTLAKLGAVLLVALAFTGAGVGIRRRGRAREEVFRREVAALEPVRSAAERAPRSVPPLLDERRRSARALLLAGRLDRRRFAELERRIDALARAARDAAATTRKAPPEPGTTALGRYAILEMLGEGSFGRTYRARDVARDREVVLKALRPDRARDETLLREARALQRIRHPNVVAFEGVEGDGDNVFLVMEHVEGGSLARRLALGPLDPVAFAQVALDVLDAIGAVHREGILHRDVKPSNILLTREGRAKLADFGVAHLPGAESTIGASATAPVGTIRFMSPEQARGKKVTRRSDLFSVAATLYEAYVGKPYLEPEPDESAVELQIRAAAAGPFSRDDVGPPALRDWFARALAPHAEDRFASADEMREALEAALAEPGPPGPDAASAG